MMYDYSYLFDNYMFTLLVYDLQVYSAALSFQLLKHSSLILILIVSEYLFQGWK